MRRTYTRGVNCGKLSLPVLVQVPVPQKDLPTLEEIAHGRGLKDAAELLGELAEREAVEYRQHPAVREQREHNLAAARREEGMVSYAFRRADRSPLAHRSDYHNGPPALGGAVQEIARHTEGGSSPASHTRGRNSAGKTATSTGFACGPVPPTGSTVQPIARGNNGKA